MHKGVAQYLAKGVAKPHNTTWRTNQDKNHHRKTNQQLEDKQTDDESTTQPLPKTLYNHHRLVMLENHSTIQ